MSWNVWLGFLVAAIVISVTPGAGAVLSMSTGLRYGYTAALRAIVGLQAALFIQLVMVALGLGAVLAASDRAFLIIKVLGALYLIWLGMRKWLAPVEAIDTDAEQTGRRENLYMQGLLVNLTNPKAMIFMVAFVPQFVNPKTPQLPQFLIILTTMIVIDIIVMSGYALLAHRCRAWLHNPRMLCTQNRVFGGLFISAGALLALSSRPQ